MKRLQITMSADTEETKLHNIRLDESEKKLLKLKNEIEDLIFNNDEIKDLVVKVSLKVNPNIIQQKGLPIPIHLQIQVEVKLERLMKNSYLERKSNRKKPKIFW